MLVFRTRWAANPMLKAVQRQRPVEKVDQKPRVDWAVQTQIQSVPVVKVGQTLMVVKAGQKLSLPALAVTVAQMPELQTRSVSRRELKADQKHLHLLMRHCQREMRYCCCSIRRGSIELESRQWLILVASQQGILRRELLVFLLCKYRGGWDDCFRR